MTRVRPLNEKKYDISKHRFLELYHFCLQYPEWMEMLKSQKDTVKSSAAGSNLGRVTAAGSATETLAIKRMGLQEKCELIEQTAIEADPDIYEYILEGVTTQYASFRYLKSKGLPCEKDMYYDRRRRFFWLLSQKK